MISIRLVVTIVIINTVLAACGTVKEAGRDDWSGVEVSGKLHGPNDEPVYEGYVYAYEHPAKGLLGPASAMSEPSGDDGRFLLVVPDGTYTLVARKRLSGAIGGPLRKGDLVSRPISSLRVRRGRAMSLDMVMTVFRQGAEGDPKKILSTSTIMRGVVLDGSGNPVAGAHVFAYEGVFTKAPPDYMSVATGKDGRFEISLPGEGDYVVGARTGLRGRPGADDLMGFWGREKRPRHITRDTVTSGVRIVITPYGLDVAP